MAMIIAGVVKAAAVAAKVAKAAKIASTVGKVAKVAKVAKKVSKVAKIAKKVKQVGDVVGGAKNVVDKLTGPSSPPPQGQSPSTNDFANMKFNAGSPAEYSPYKMKGSPMQRNFGISPAKHKPWAEEHREKSAHQNTAEAHGKQPKNSGNKPFTDGGDGAASRVKKAPTKKVTNILSNGVRSANKTKTVSPKTSTKAASFGSKTLKNFRNSVISSSDKSTTLGPKNTVGSEIKRGAKEFTESALGRMKNLKVPSASSKVVKALSAAGKVARVAGRVSGALGVAELGYRAYKSGQKHSGGKVNKNQKSNTMGFGKSSIFNKNAPAKNYKKGYYGA